MLKKLIYLAFFAGLVYFVISMLTGSKKFVQAGSSYQSQSNNIGQQAIGMEKSAQKAASEANQSINELQGALNGVSQGSGNNRQ